VRCLARIVDLQHMDLHEPIEVMQSEALIAVVASIYMYVSRGRRSFGLRNDNLSWPRYGEWE